MCQKLNQVLGYKAERHSPLIIELHVNDNRFYENPEEENPGLRPQAVQLELWPSLAMGTCTDHLTSL